MTEIVVPQDYRAKFYEPGGSLKTWVRRFLDGNTEAFWFWEDERLRQEVYVHGDPKAVVTYNMTASHGLAEMVWEGLPPEHQHDGAFVGADAAYDAAKDAELIGESL